MQVPFKTETDAFRVAVALAAVAAAAALVGWLTSRPYGIVLFAAGVAAGVTFELAGRPTDGRSALRDAAAAPHPHTAPAGTRRILVVAGVALGGAQLRADLVAAGGDAVELDVLAPILASRAHVWASDIDRERDEARVRLAASLEWAARNGFAAKGEIGDADPLVAIEDELREFGADEVIVAADPREQKSWLANRMLAHLSKELDMPIRTIAIGDDERRAAAPAESLRD